MGATNGERDALDLDALERDETAEPFEFTVAGQTFSLIAPGDIDWHYAQALEDGSPEMLLQALLGDQYDAFTAIPLPGWKVNKLLMAWGTHNGVDLGEFSASSGSSVTTVAQSRPTSVATTASGSRTSPRGG
jgi:hypothetical protein